MTQPCPSQESRSDVLQFQQERSRFPRPNLLKPPAKTRVPRRRPTTPAPLIVKAHSQGLSGLKPCKTCSPEVPAGHEVERLSLRCSPHLDSVEELHADVFSRSMRTSRSFWPVKCLDHEYFATGPARSRGRGSWQRSGRSLRRPHEPRQGISTQLILLARLTS